MRINKFFVTTIMIGILSFSAAYAEDISPEVMFKRLSALSSTSNADVKYNIGMFLNNGIGTSRNNKAAFQYFSEAADAGNELAAYKVGCYFAGQFPGTVPTDMASALKFKLRAAEAGYDLAQYDAGLTLWKKGETEHALIWLERASRQANVQATTFLARYFSSPSSPDKIKGYALVQILKTLVPNPDKEFLDHIARLDTQFSNAEKSEADTIRASWVTGLTPLSLHARIGIKAVPELLRSLEP